MEVVQKKMWVPYAKADVYALVADIPAYPDFLPWCSGAQALRTMDQVVEASLTLKKGSLTKSFVTRNIMTPCDQIEIHLVSGPFKHLYGVWQFTEKDKGVEVDLRLEFSFDNRLIAMMIGPLFNQVANTLLEAFMTRAADVCTPL